MKSIVLFAALFSGASSYAAADTRSVTISGQIQGPDVVPANSQVGCFNPFAPQDSARASVSDDGTFSVSLNSTDLEAFSCHLLSEDLSVLAVFDFTDVNGHSSNIYSLQNKQATQVEIRTGQLDLVKASIEVKAEDVVEEASFFPARLRFLTISGQLHNVSAVPFPEGAQVACLSGYPGRVSASGTLDSAGRYQMVLTGHILNNISCDLMTQDFAILSRFQIMNRRGQDLGAYVLKNRWADELHFPTVDVDLARGGVVISEDAVVEN